MTVCISYLKLFNICSVMFRTCLLCLTWHCPSRCQLFSFYQLPLLLTALSHIAWKTVSISRHVPLSGHNDIAFFEWRCKWRWINTKIENYIIMASLKRETIGKLINRMPGSRLLISSLPGSASLVMSTSVLKALPGKLDIKRHSPIFSFSTFTDLISWSSTRL